MAKSFRIKDGKFLVVAGKFAVGDGACGCCSDCPCLKVTITGLHGTLAIYNGEHTFTPGLRIDENHCQYSKILSGTTPASYECEFDPPVPYNATLVVVVHTGTNTFSATLDDIASMTPFASQAFTPIDRDVDGAPYNFTETYRECQGGVLESVENEDDATISAEYVACP